MRAPFPAITLATVAGLLGACTQGEDDGLRAETPG
jgi:hypothetical protein